MQIGFGQDGRIDCSGLVGLGLMRVLGLAGWPPGLRHTREMFPGLEAVESPRSLGELVRVQDQPAIGSLIFSHRWRRAEWVIGHVSILTGYEEGSGSEPVPVWLQAQAGREGKVVERPPFDLGIPERPADLVFSWEALARLVFERRAEVARIALPTGE